MASSNSAFAPSKTILITGGASGIGLAVAKLCYGKHGMNVAVVDTNADGLAQAESSPSFAASNTQTFKAYKADVSSLEEWGTLKDKFVKDFGGKLDVLMLNAGIQMKASWADSAYFHRVMDVNLFGQIHGLNTLLPLLQETPLPAAGESSSGAAKAVIMTGSKQGITNPPGSPAYNASKAAVKALAEHLSFDLATASPNISVHLLVPGYTFTGITGGGGLKEKPAAAWSPEQVADRLEAAVAKGKDQFWVICPDNEVTEEMDQRRMMWTAGDAVFARPPLSRWRPDWKDKAGEWMAERRF